MQRTISNAKQAIDNMPLKGHERFKVEQAYEQRVEELREHAARGVARESASLTERGDRYLSEAREVEAELVALAKRMEGDGLPLDEATASFHDLTDRLDRLHRLAKELPNAAQGLRDREADPIAYLDGMFSKYPRTMPDWPW